MSTVDVIRKLQATSSRTDKEQIILDAWMSGERDFFSGVKLAYDILISFGVKKVAEIVEDSSGTTSTFTFKDFEVLAGKLRKRELTGSAARDAIHAAAERCDTATWNEFYRNVLLKDLRCGITETSVNKVLAKLAKSDPTAHQYIVPVWSCQLAKDGGDEKNAHRICGTKMLDVKLDGVRLLTIVDKEAGSVTQYTRNGKENTSFPHVVAVFEQLMENLPCSMVFDGEITAKSFQELMTQVNRKKNKDSSETKLALFDCLPLEDFKKGICTMPQRERHQVLTGYFGLMMTLATGGEVYVVPKITVNLDTKEGYEEFKRFNREALEAGYEGIMVKDPEAPYETDRTYSWLKVKPFIEVSLTATAWKPGDKGTKFEKVMGAVLFEGEDDGKQVSVWCGGGWSEKDREDIAKNWDKKYKGFIGEVKADCFSLEQGATVYALRFPRFKGWRGTKPGEKL